MDAAHETVGKVIYVVKDAAISSGRASGVCSSEASYGPCAPDASRGLAFQVEGDFEPIGIHRGDGAGIDQVSLVDVVPC